MVQGPGVATTGTRAAADEGGEDRSGGGGKGGSGDAAAPARPEAASGSAVGSARDTGVICVMTEAARTQQIWKDRSLKNTNVRGVS